MNWWQTALILFAVLWVLQSLGTWIQMTHYRKVMTEVAKYHKDGFLGTGNAKSNFGNGLIVMLVATAEGVVSKALVMEGRTVFARFKEIPELSGVKLDELEKPEFFGPASKARAEAFGKAIAQIRSIQQESSKMAAKAGKGGDGR